MLSSRYKRNGILAAYHYCFLSVAKEMWFLPLGRDPIRRLKNSRYFLHITDIQQACRCKLEVFPQVFFLLNDSVAFATFQQQLRNTSCYLGYPWFTRCLKCRCAKKEMITVARVTGTLNHSVYTRTAGIMSMCSWGKVKKKTVSYYPGTSSL